VVECGEALRDAGEVAGIVIDERTADPAGGIVMVRIGVWDRLAEAQQRLPSGWRLVLVEGWRSAAWQRHLCVEYLALLGRRHPGWDPERQLREAHRVAPPPEFASHVSGGAVDVTLATPDGALAWMGTEVNAYPEDCDGACRTDANNVSETAARHRILLHQVLSPSGLVNDPAKWWHWSFGDRFWALRTGAVAACYAAIPDIKDP